MEHDDNCDPVQLVLCFPRETSTHGHPALILLVTTIIAEPCHMTCSRDLHLPEVGGESDSALKLE
jgi:hypothetical protein